MSSLTHAPSTLGPAPWRPQFLEHINLMPSPEFVLSTVSRAGPDSPTPYVPRARFCIYRGMFGELPENKHNTGPFNPHVFESDMPTFTTDVRSDKVVDLFSSSRGHGNSAQSVGSGGGGPVEAVFWVKEVMTQWRIRGDAFVLAQDLDEEEKGGSSGIRTVKSKVGERMRVVPGTDRAAWKWNRELDGHWGNLSPGMRGSFRNPLPGSKTSDNCGEMGEGLGLGIKSGTDDEGAKKNFRVVVIRPFEVESLDLADPSKARRWRYTYGNKEGEWTIDELWP